MQEAGIDSVLRRHHVICPMNLFAAAFSFSFAGFFAPQTRGGLSPSNV